MFLDFELMEKLNGTNSRLPPRRPIDPLGPEWEPKPPKYERWLLEGFLSYGLMSYCSACFFSTTASKVLAVQTLAFTAAHILTDGWAIYEVSTATSLKKAPTRAEKWLLATAEQKWTIASFAAAAVVATSAIAGNFIESNRPGLNLYPFDAASRAAISYACTEPQTIGPTVNYTRYGTYNSGAFTCDWLMPRPAPHP